MFKRPRFRVQAGPLRVLASENDLEGPRLGMVVAKRLASRAVDRNRIKRNIRESFREQSGSLPALDVIVQLTRDPAQEDLKARLGSLWRELIERAGDQGI